MTGSVVLKLLGVLSALVLHVLIWTVIAAFTTVGLAVADASEGTFFVTWAFFAAVIIAGTVLTVSWAERDADGSGASRSVGHSCSS